MSLLVEAVRNHQEGDRVRNDLSERGGHGAADLHVLRKTKNRLSKLVTASTISMLGRCLPWTFFARFGGCFHSNYGIYRPGRRISGFALATPCPGTVLTAILSSFSLSLFLSVSLFKTVNANRSCDLFLSGVGFVDRGDGGSAEFFP